MGIGRNADLLAHVIKFCEAVYGSVAHRLRFATDFSNFALYNNCAVVRVCKTLCLTIVLNDIVHFFGIAIYFAIVLLILEK